MRYSKVQISFEQFIRQSASVALLIFYLFYQERIQLETARLYKLSGVDPLAG
jgi:hypothetical protein